jgi:hypothetical protein
MMIDFSRRQPVTMIGIRIAKKNGKENNNQNQITARQVATAFFKTLVRVEFFSVLHGKIADAF